MWLFGVITEYRMVTLAREKLEQMFPALQRLTGVLFDALFTSHRMSAGCLRACTVAYNSVCTVMTCEMLMSPTGQEQEIYQPRNSRFIYSPSHVYCIVTINNALGRYYLAFKDSTACIHLCTV